VAADNRTIIDVPACPLAHPAINETLERLRRDADFMTSFGENRRLTLRRTAADGVAHWRGPAPSEMRLTEQTAIGPLTVPCGSFFQVNPAVADHLFEEAARVVAEQPPDRLIDLYCGVGIFALAAARAGAKRVIGIDSDERAIRIALANARSQGVENAQFMAGHATHEFERIACQGEGGRTAVIVDPPRTGLDRKLIALLATIRPDPLIYVSCAADTLARDVALLTGQGYRLRRSRVLDMFPRTAWFETLTVLTCQHV
jgi:23S rRNA (uracil1939-C5)-methyltransferase